MKANAELYRETLAAVRGPWFWRCLVALLLLETVCGLPSRLVGEAYDAMSITTAFDLAVAKFEAARQGLGYALPNVEATLWMAGATAFLLFIGWIFGAISAFGLASVALKAADDDEQDWLGGAFAGFRRPFGLFWLQFQLELRLCLWTLLFIVPGIVAAYRYRNAWFNKAEHPDWTARACLAASAAQMRGSKFQAFRFDLHYALRLFLLLLAIAASTRFFGVLNPLVATGVFLMACLLCLVPAIRMMMGLFIGRAVFYRALPRPAAE